MQETFPSPSVRASSSGSLTLGFDPQWGLGSPRYDANLGTPRIHFNKESRMKHHVYYHMDADGHCSAGIVQEYLERTHGKDVEIEFQPINYGMKPYTRNIQHGDKVYMLDFSLQPAVEMRDFVMLCDKYRCTFTWIDHHATVFATLDEYPMLKNVAGIRTKEKKAGCELTWEFYNQDRPIPKLITLISDWDTWRKHSPEEWSRLVVPLQAYLRFMRSDPKHNRRLWPTFLRANQDELLATVEEKGGMLATYQQQLDDSKMRGFSRRGTFAGLKAIIVNSPQMNSTPFERMNDFSEIDICVAWVFTKQGQFSVSVYTVKPEIDAGALCKKLGEEGPYKSGGGHPGAAGFQTDWEHLSQLMSF